MHGSERKSWHSGKPADDKAATSQYAVLSHNLNAYCYGISTEKYKLKLAPENPLIMYLFPFLLLLSLLDYLKGIRYYE